MYAYDKEYYDGFQEHRPCRPSGYWAKERDRQRRRSERERRHDDAAPERGDDQRVAAEQDHERGDAPAVAREEDTLWVQDDVARGPGRRLGGEGRWEIQ